MKGNFNMKIKLVNFIVLIEDNKKISVLVYQNNQTVKEHMV